MAQTYVSSTKFEYPVPINSSLPHNNLNYFLLLPYKLVSQYMSKIMPILGSSSYLKGPLKKIKLVGVYFCLKYSELKSMIGT